MEGREDISTIELLDPDDAHTKGRSRMMTIVEAIKVGKFYKYGHCGEFGHTVKSCQNLNKEYHLPKPKRTREKKMNDSGNKDTIGAADATPITRTKMARKAQPTKKKQNKNDVKQPRNHEQSTMFMQDQGELQEL